MASLAALAGCGPDPAAAVDAARPVDARPADAAVDAAVPPGTLGRAGDVMIGEAELLVAVEEARALQHWRDGKPPPMEALASPMLRRRLVIQALETRVVRAEVARRQLVVPVRAVEDALRNAAEGRPFDAARSAEEAPLDPDALHAALVARYGAVAGRLRAVAEDLLGARLLAESLLDAEDDKALQARWLAEGTQIVADVILVPRVPTNREIEAAVKLRSGELATWFDGHRALFHRPLRRRVVRVGVPVGERPRLEALLARAQAGEDVEALAREVDPKAQPLPPVTADRLPSAFAVAVGTLTPIVEDAGGLAFYRVVAELPGMERSLSEVSVQREVAAALLREQDALPTARATVEAVAALLAREPEGAALAERVRADRLRRKTTRRFSQAGPALVPEVGVAPELFNALFGLRAVGAVSPIFTVRQDYVVARLVERTAPDPATWPAERAAFVARWRAAERSRVVDAWLSTRLQGAPLWIDQPAVERLAIPGAPPVGAKPGAATP
ncbi:MAG: peptidyl-prolyl cis-trans isomerase [Myxococcales bacterium]|nr:peptidyl-prolyl cis-trans isomerase [Myxococcales bacterium]